MPRKGWVLRRKIPGDPVFGSDLVQKFISSMMYDGKRATAQSIFYNAMDQVAKKTNDDSFKLFKKAIENCKPVLEVKTRRGKTMTDKLAEEIMDAANGRGGAVKKKEDVHRMAEANKAFAHYRW